MAESEAAGEANAERGSSAPGGGTETGATSGDTGLESNVAGALAYVFGLLSGFAMLVLEGDDEFVRFHAIQSIAFNVAMIAAYVALGFVGFFLSLVPFVGDVLAVFVGFLNPLLGLGAFLLWAFLLYKAYQGERFELPVLGPIAASN